MNFKHIIVHLDGGGRTAARLELAVHLASRFGAQVTGLFVDTEPARGRAEGISRTWREAAADLQGLARGAGLASDCWQVDGAELEPGRIAARYCRYGDLTIVGQHDPDDGRVPADFGEQVLLESGGPVLVVPFVGSFQGVGRRVVLAWDGTREAARALKDALPLIDGAAADIQVALLHRAREGSWADASSGPSVIRLLAAHGIAASREPVLVDERDDGMTSHDVVLNLASDAAADLVVMGARGRPGGPFPRASRRTRASLSAMTAPILLSV